ncbi:hypothetical protein BSKO_04908 [Bryopsis sp. KO-2023]|nr:hypothetical protein BSKO_04908 [Bryopsis sp. KO-2023]
MAMEVEASGTNGSLLPQEVAEVVEGGMAEGDGSRKADAMQGAETAAPPQQNGAGIDAKDENQAEAGYSAGYVGAVSGVAETPGAAANPLVQKYNDYWKAVREDPGDFPTWTYLLSTVEKLEDLPRIREAFDAFLGEYPLCYGYWKKYADAENKYAGTDTAYEVYNRGVQSVPYSVDLWCHCVAFHQENGKGASEEIRRLFEQGLAYVGTDYLSHALWDKYLNFEASQENVLNQSQLYTRILGYPIKELNRYYQSFKDFAAQHSATDLMSDEELKQLKTQVEQKKQESKMAGTSASTAATPAQPPPPQQEEPTGTEMEEDTTPPEQDATAEISGGEVVEGNGMVEGGTTKEGGEEAIKTDETAQQESMEVEPCPPGAETEEIEVSLDEIKEAWIQLRNSLFETASEELGKRRPFEECIKRPYFHTKPLDSVQLQAWAKYLDYMEALPDASPETVTVYERCLVACACYPEFWKRYVRYMEKSDVERARGILERTTLVHCKSKADLHLFAAHFDERHGNAESARKRFKHVQTTLAPRMVSMIVQFVNFERRQGNLEAACSIYSECIEEELAKESSETCAFLCIQYAHFLSQVVADHRRGREVLDKALAAKPASKALWEGAIHFEECVWKEDSVARIVELYEKCISKPKLPEEGMSQEDREEMSLRFIDFVDMHCDAAKHAEAEGKHATAFPSTMGCSESRKRPAASELETAPAKSGRTGMEAYAGMQTAMQAGQPGGTAVQAAAAPPNTMQAQSYYQAQPQQTAAAAQQYAQYAQYYGYSGYGYTGYGY